MVDDGEGSTSPRTPEVDTEPPLSSPRKSASTTPSEKKPNSMWKAWKELAVAEKIGYCAVALPALPLVIAFGPIIALHLMLEKDNAQFYRDPDPTARTPRTWEESYEYQLGNVPTGPSFASPKRGGGGRKRTPTRKSGSSPAADANQLWLKNKRKSTRLLQLYGGDGNLDGGGGGEFAADDIHGEPGILHSLVTAIEEEGLSDDSSEEDEEREDHSPTAAERMRTQSGGETPPRFTTDSLRSARENGGGGMPNGGDAANANGHGHDVDGVDDVVQATDLSDDFDSAERALRAGGGRASSTRSSSTTSSSIDTGSTYQTRVQPIRHGFNLSDTGSTCQTHSGQAPPPDAESATKQRISWLGEEGWTGAEKSDCAGETEAAGGAKQGKSSNVPLCCFGCVRGSTGSTGRNVVMVEGTVKGRGQRDDSLLWEVGPAGADATDGRTDGRADADSVQKLSGDGFGDSPLRR